MCASAQYGIGYQQLRMLLFEWLHQRGVKQVSSSWQFFRTNEQWERGDSQPVDRVLLLRLFLQLNLVAALMQGLYEGCVLLCIAAAKRERGEHLMDILNLLSTSSTAATAQAVKRSRCILADCSMPGIKLRAMNGSQYGCSFPSKCRASA